MGILDSLFGRKGDSGPTPRQIAAVVKTLEFRHGEPARRYEAIDRLAQWQTPEATEALLRRFSFNSESVTSDEEEKNYVAELLVKKGSGAVRPLLDYLRHEGEVGWALRVLEKIVSPQDFRERVLGILAKLDVQFDREPQRKVDLIGALVPHGTDPQVLDTVATFLEDTDDRVVIAAAELVAATGRKEDSDRLVEALTKSEDRPRVRAALCTAMAEHGLSVKGRKADVEPLLPEGYYLTRDGTVKRLGKAES